MNSTTYLTLDLQAPNFAVMASAKQNDTLGRQIAATLRDGSASFDATGLLCEIRYAKPDGTVGFYDTLEDDVTPAYSIDGNVVTFTLAEQMLTVAGAVYVDLNFYAATGEKLTAFTFTLNVEASVLDDGTIVSSDYYNVLTATLAEAAEIAANLPVPSESTPIKDSASGSAGTGNGFARGNHSHPINVATSGTPANLGAVASNGTSANYARQDHVHKAPTAGEIGALPNSTTAADLGVEYEIYNNITELGLTVGTATITDAWNALYTSAALVCSPTVFATGSSGVPYAAGGLFVMVKGLTSADGFILLHYTSASYGDFRMYIAQNGPTGKWLGSRDLLWTNSSPTSSFAAQTVAVDLSGYDFITVVAYESTSNAVEMSATISNTIGAKGRLFLMANSRQFRAIEIGATGVVFGVGRSGAISETAAEDNTAAVPVYIYGIAK